MVQYQEWEGKEAEYQRKSMTWQSNENNHRNYPVKIVNKINVLNPGVLPKVSDDQEERQCALVI